MQFCPYCGTPQEDGSKFCAACGKSLAAPQQPQYQAPQYQPQYQQPVYQVPQYQAPQHQPAPSHPQAHLQGAKKAANTAFILLICGTVMQPLAYIINIIGSGFPFASILSTLTNLLYPCLLIAFLPVLAKIYTANGITRRAKSLQTFAIIFLAAQALGAVVIAVIFNTWSGASSLYDALNIIFSDIAGSGIIDSFLIIFRGGMRYLLSNLLWLGADLCFWGVSIFTLVAASKLKKS